MLTSTSTRSSLTSSKSTRRESGCLQSTRLRLLAHRLVFKLQVVLAQVLLVSLELQPRDVHRLPSSQHTLKLLEAIKEPSLSHSLRVLTAIRCHQPLFNHRDIRMATHHSTQLHVLQAVSYLSINSVASHRRPVTKDFRIVSHHPPKLLIPATLADMQAVFQPPMMAGSRRFRVCR